MTSFIPCSTFGRYALEQTFQSRNTYLAVQLLYVPTSVTGDRSTWTWSNNWKNYVVTGAYSGSGGGLNLLTQGVSPPQTITEYEEATSPWPGAYYEGSDASFYARVYNSTAFQYVFTHVAIFAMQSNTATFTPAAGLLDESLVAVQPFYQAQTSLGLNSGSSFYLYLGPDDLSGIIAWTGATSFQDWVDKEEAWVINILGPQTYTQPYPSPGTSWTYRNNKYPLAYFTDAYKTTLGFNATDSTATFLAELLNVTGAEPDFEEGWSGWSTYRINRYAVATVPTQYTYTDKELSYIIDIFGTDYDISWAGQEVRFTNPIEFIFNAPATSSYTFTHIAVFANEIDTPPPDGTAYTYTDVNKFIGVIKLTTGVTMTTTSTRRAYPFNFSFMYEADVTVEEVGS